MYQIIMTFTFNCRINGDGYADILLCTSMCLSVLKSIQYKYTHNVTVEVRFSCFDSAGSRERGSYDRSY